MRLTVDSNILIYTFDPRDALKRDIAKAVLKQARSLDMVLASQALGEFLNIIRRKKIGDMLHAVRLAELWSSLFPVFATKAEHIIAGGRLALSRKLQFWDSVLLETSRAAGVATILTEDLQDGATINGVRIMNPFRPANGKFLAELLG